MVAPLLIRKEEAENKETSPSSEANKTATEGTDQKPHLFLSMFLSKITKENNHHGQVISSQSVQAKCKQRSLIILIAFAVNMISSTMLSRREKCSGRAVFSE